MVRYPVRALVPIAIASVVACSPVSHPSQPASPAVAPVRVESLTVKAPATSAAQAQRASGDEHIPTPADPFARLDRMDWPPAQPRAHRGWPSRSRLLAAARRLRHRGDARHRAAHDQGARVARVHEQLARHAALRVDAARSESVQVRERGIVSLSRRHAIRRPRLRRRLRDSESRHERREGDVGGASDADARRAVGAARAARRQGDDRDGLQLHGARARLGSHGARRPALRDRAVVPAGGRVRRRAWVEHRSVPGAGRVLSRVRRHQLRRHRSGGVRRGGERRAAESARGTERCAALAARERRAQRHRNPNHHRGRSEAGGDERNEDVALSRATRARCRVGRRAGLPLGCDELEGRDCAGVLRVAEGGRRVDACGRGDAVDDSDVLAAGAAVSRIRRRRR